GGSLTVGGTLSNTKTVAIGSTVLNAAKIGRASGRKKPRGASSEVFGSPSHPATLAFSVGGSGFTSNGGLFRLSNTTPLTLSSDFTNSGTVALEGTAMLTVTGKFDNSGALSLDSSNFGGGGSLTVGGTLSNTKTVAIGSTVLNAA